ncbi:MAG: DUF4271 domain-containing protein, partial [Bacteroidales bacterium]|nr:DUF4271 domain-containing protein [Bacteroidales bacterium]
MTFLEPHRLAVQHERLLPMPDKAVYDTELYLLAALLLYAYLLYRTAPRLLAYFRFLFDWRALDKITPGRQGHLGRQMFYTFCLVAVSFVTLSLYLYQWAAHPGLTARYFGPLPAWLSGSERDVLARLFVLVTVVFGCKWLLLYGLSGLFKETAFGTAAIRLETGYLFFWVLWALPVLLVSFGLPWFLPFALFALSAAYILILLFRWFKMLVL